MESIDHDFVALDIDTAQNAIIGHPHNNHLILVVSAILLLKADGLGSNLSLGVIGRLLFILLAAVPESTTIETRDAVLLIYLNDRNIRSIRS